MRVIVASGTANCRACWTPIDPADGWHFIRLPGGVRHDRCEGPGSVGERVTGGKRA